MIRYCIIHCTLEVETSERLNVGMAMWTGTSYVFRWSRVKMDALRLMLPAEVWGFLHDALVGMENGAELSGVDSLHRYSNNLLTVSPVVTVSLEPTEENMEDLYHRYIRLS